MRIACCTTTINVPHVLSLYRASASAGKFYVAIDKKTPTEAIDFLTKHRFNIIDAGDEWKCSALLPWNSLSRRNLAFLAALRDGAQAIVSVDDDNSPIGTSYFWDIETKIFRTFDGLCASSRSGWFDAGTLLVPWVKMRGVPHGQHRPVYRPIVKAKVGVISGLVLGDSDIDATTRIEMAPEVHSVSEIGQNGMVVALDTHCALNTQNTAVIRELVPAWFLFPNARRFDDIFAGLVVQRVAKERELHVYCGRPFAWQTRNEHDLVADLRAEIDGYQYVRPMADLLDQIVLKGKSVIEDVRMIYEKLRHAKWINSSDIDAGMLWLEDCEAVGCV